MAVETEFIRTIIAICLFLFAAKLLAEGFSRIKIPIVLGELVAGIIIGPFALGGLFMFEGEPLVTLNESVRVIGEIGAIVILFIVEWRLRQENFCVVVQLPLQLVP